MPALAQRSILHQTLAGSVGVGVYSFAVGSLHRFSVVRLCVQAASSALTLQFQQQISSHGTIFDVTSGAFAVTSGGAVEYAVYANQGRFQIAATSATPLRIEAAGLPQV